MPWVSIILPCWDTIWGAREAYTLAALFPDRVTAIAALALGYQPRGTFSLPSFEQSRRFWYQWFMCTDGGAEAVRQDPVGFARLQWETWSPSGWFDDAEFTRTAECFSGPDWAAVTLNAYRPAGDKARLGIRVTMLCNAGSVKSNIWRHRLS